MSEAEGGRSRRPSRCDSIGEAAFRSLRLPGAVGVLDVGCSLHVSLSVSPSRLWLIVSGSARKPELRFKRTTICPTL